MLKCVIKKSGKMIPYHLFIVKLDKILAKVNLMQNLSYISVTRSPLVFFVI
jgi:hypothetical protein